MLAHVRNGRVVKLEGNPEYPMSKGALCAKALSGVSALYHPNRNKYPLLRVGKRGENKWRRISWNEAIDIIAKKMETVRHEYGAEACSSPLAAAAILHSAAFHAFATPLEHQTGTNQGARSVISRERSPTT